MAKPKNLSSEIIRLRNEGKTYKEICNILNCAKSSVTYHLNSEYRLSSRLRVSRYRKNHPIYNKIAHFLDRSQKTNKSRKIINNSQKLLYVKIHKFQREGNMSVKDFTTQDVLDKFGQNPKCYLTGVDIDLTKSKTYSLDHIIPVSRGGDNSLSNMGLCTSLVNRAKTDMTPDEFINLCKLVIEHNKNDS
jgi:5-methylcytosine-specific restriction endonuclease McrA